MKKRKMLFYSALLMFATIPCVLITPVLGIFTAGGSVILLVKALRSK